MSTSTQYTVREAAERLRLSTGSVYALVTSGQLSCMRVGPARGRIFISEEAIQDYLQQAQKVPEPLPQPTHQRGRKRYVHLGS